MAPTIIRASYTKEKDYYMPCIVYSTGFRETLWGDALIDRKTAIKYAQLTINERNNRKVKS